jgi:urease accessory protein
MGTTGPADKPVIRPMLMSSDPAGAKVSLMPEGALLLAGDAIAIDVVVGPGAHLELVEPAGTVAYAMDGGRASWDVTIELGPAATLVWAGEPFVVAEGASVDRSTTIRLGAAAAMAWREMVVLGRHSERPGWLRQELSVVGHNNAAMLAEDLELGPASGRLLLGGARALGTVLVLGRRLPPGVEQRSGTRLDLEGDGTLVRHLCTDAHQATMADVWQAARRLVGDGVRLPKRSVPAAIP